MEDVEVLGAAKPAEWIWLVRTPLHPQHVDVLTTVQPQSDEEFRAQSMCETNVSQTAGRRGGTGGRTRAPMRRSHSRRQRTGEEGGMLVRMSRQLRCVRER